jgi:hypothetical protein
VRRFRRTTKETRKALKRRSRNFTMQNEVEEDDWLTCGFINYAHQKGIAEIQVSHKLMPFLVELSTNTQHILYTLQCRSK